MTDIVGGENLCDTLTVRRSSQPEAYIPHNSSKSLDKHDHIDLSASSTNDTNIRRRSRRQSLSCFEIYMEKLMEMGFSYSEVSYLITRNIFKWKKVEQILTYTNCQNKIEQVVD